MGGYASIAVEARIRLPLQRMGINSNRAVPRATKFTDEEFLQGLRSRDNETLKALYRKHYPAVLKFILSNSGSDEQAKDIYQETIIVLYENVKRPEFGLTCALQTYIYSVARRLWLKQLNRSGRTVLFREEGDHEIADVSADLNEHLEKEKEISRMNASLEKLGEPCAGLIRDFYVSRLSMDEIGEKYGYTNADNAKTQKYKCLQRLKRYFFEKETVSIVKTE